MTSLPDPHRISARHAPQAPIFRTRGLTRVYAIGEVSVQALRGLDVDLSSGELLVLLGPLGV
ncbi:hypothetical protein G3480_17360 [Thiorhodococcus mannitoliphagus]|uniref:Macrolide ABC transporter ATP-binding protein n=1 Tax=Thiorhodococcus mannitoliphagus TaxID=329406 RepID=A0A6P1DY93_9GAMM|nr:hypothetical protein [Thiorhodococcus mannitoliphagus]NEX22053.1 hypothetical protein [Thiorhodococcus mannitoliphagus]